jgi:hypothetical protein
LNLDYDRFIDNLNEVNIFPIVKDVIDIADKTDIVPSYYDLAKYIDKHFDVEKNDELKDVFTELAKSDLFTNFNNDIDKGKLI